MFASAPHISSAGLDAFLTIRVSTPHHTQPTSSFSVSFSFSRFSYKPISFSESNRATTKVHYVQTIAFALYSSITIGLRLLALSFCTPKIQDPTCTSLLHFVLLEKHNWFLQRQNCIFVVLISSNISYACNMSTPSSVVWVLRVNGEPAKRQSPTQIGMNSLSKSYECSKRIFLASIVALN